MRIMTYNIQSGWNNEKPRERNYDFACGVIREYSPDIVGLNEVGNKTIAGIPSHSGYMGEKLGMNDFFAPAMIIGGYPYGNAMLTKYELRSAHIVTIPNPPRVRRGFYEPRCLLEALADTDIGETSILISHFGLVESEQINAVKTVCDTIDRIRLEAPKRSIILMGDLNMTPDDEKLRPIFSRLSEVTFSVGSPLPTHPSPEPRSKIDYIFISDGLKADSITVPHVTASDHCPIIADISLIG